MGTQSTNIWKTDGTAAITYTVADETWHILDDVFVGSNANHAVRSSVANSTLINDGTIFSGWGEGVQFLGGGATITNNVGASIAGMSGIAVNGAGATINNYGAVNGYGNYGIVFGADSTFVTLNNHGEISGGFAAVYAFSNFDGGIINNYGRILSDQHGIRVATNTGLTTIINNAAGATIEGESTAVSTAVGQISFTNDGAVNGSIRCDALGGNDTIVNRGVITGAVTLGTGNDVYDGRLGTITIFVDGRAGEDQLYSGAGSETMYGGDGNDLLRGGKGNDLLDGQDGVDTADYSDKIDPVVVTLNGPVDVNVTVKGIIEDTIRNIENLTGGSAADKLLGDAAANILRGGPGNDTLRGGGGEDLLEGGAGVDTVHFSSAPSGVLVQLESQWGFAEGFDLGIETIENVIGSAFDDSLDGDAAANRLSGGGGNDELNGGLGSDTLDGGTGTDVMEGGSGNDTFYVDNVLDKTIEANVVGTDTVYTSVSKAFADQFVEVIRLSGSANINTTGNNLANTIVGNSANNAMNGRGAADTLIGGDGNDTFVFNTTLGGGNIDTITDFNVANDTIQLDDAIFTALGLGVLAAGAFRTNVTGAAQDADDRIIYESDSGKVWYDSNGNVAGGNFLFAELAGGLVVTNADFLVV